MGFSLIPKVRIKNISELTPDFLLRRGISLIMLDLDNTLAPYSGAKPSDELFAWKASLISAGITPFIVSNTKTKRAEKFAALWGVDYVNEAKKPRSRGINAALEKTGRRPSDAALAGDQIFTDILGANLAGLISIIVHPIELKNPFYILRYIAELPFRALRRKEKIQ